VAENAYTLNHAKIFSKAKADRSRSTSGLNHLANSRIAKFLSPTPGDERLGEPIWDNGVAGDARTEPQEMQSFRDLPHTLVGDKFVLSMHQYRQLIFLCVTKDFCHG